MGSSLILISPSRNSGFLSFFSLSRSLSRLSRFLSDRSRDRERFRFFSLSLSRSRSLRSLFSISSTSRSRLLRFLRSRDLLRCLDRSRSRLSIRSPRSLGDLERRRSLNPWKINIQK